MRQFKFRGYDKVNKRMFEVFGLGQDWCTEDTLDGISELDNCWRGADFKERIEISEFTNRYAKGPVEIFFGDIIKIHRTVDFIGDVRQRAGGQYYVNHKAAYLKYEHQIHCEICETESPTFFLDFLDEYEIEVIGNIYESPQLLTP